MRKPYHHYAIVVATYIISVPAYGGRSAQSEPEPAGSEPAIDQPSATLPATESHTQTPLPTASYTQTLPPTASHTQTLTPTATLIFTPTKTSTPTEPSLPPLPGFDDVLSFGSGGAEDGFCRDWGDTTSCYFHDVPQWSASSNMAQIEIANSMVNNWITLASQSAPVEVVGRNFPASTPASILLYVVVLDPSEMPGSVAHPNGRYQLVDGWVVAADSREVVDTSITVQWQSGKKYLLVGSTNQGGKLQLRFSDNPPPGREETDPWVVFLIRVDVSSCPGAPQQRLIVNQRGYVCTKGDNVLLRNVPNRSGATLDSLLTGTQFTVLDGPACADNWSWWQICTDYGIIGWIAEGGDEIDPCFICPLP